MKKPEPPNKNVILIIIVEDYVIETIKKFIIESLFDPEGGRGITTYNLLIFNNFSLKFQRTTLYYNSII